MVLTDYAENKIYDALLRSQALGNPATWHVALSTALRSDSGGPTEPSGNNYSRSPVAASLANFSGTQGAGTTVASTGTDGTGENNVPISWPTSSGAWGEIKSVWFMDAASGGNGWISIDLVSPLNVSGSGFTLTFAAGQLQFQIDN